MDFFCSKIWADYFNEAGLKAVFFSAIDVEEESDSEVFSFL
jgi:hypothetical protein